MKPEPASDRTAMLRASLVETVDATPARRARLRPRFVVAAIAAFALAGAATGGGIAAFAASRDGGDDATETVTISTASFAEQILGSHAQTFGTPFIVSGSGKIIVELGERPEGATSLLLLTGCVEAGHLDVKLDGEWHGGQDCDGPHGGGGGFTPVEGRRSSPAGSRRHGPLSHLGSMGRRSAGRRSPPPPSRPRWPTGS